jgi:hypothetical protein
MLRLLLVLLAVCVGLTAASAQEPVRRNERYCLMMSGIGGPDMMLCRFETLEQCRASRTAQGEQCLLNPYLAFRLRDEGRR